MIDPELEVKVAGLQTGLKGVETEQHRLRNDFQRMQGELTQSLRTTESTLNTKIDQAQSGLYAKIDQLSANMTAQSQPKWGTIWAAAGVCVVVIGMLTGFFYWAISAEQRHTNETVMAVSKVLVPRSEHEREWRWNEQALGVLTQRTEKLTDQMLPRELFTQFSSSTQRQIDDLRRDFGQTYNLRDVINSLERKTSELEKELRSAHAAPPR